QRDEANARAPERPRGAVADDQPARRDLLVATRQGEGQGDLGAGQRGASGRPPDRHPGGGDVFGLAELNLPIHGLLDREDGGNAGRLTALLRGATSVAAHETILR